MAIKADVVGAWLMHHDQKLSGVRSIEFESIATAGRAARLLSYISQEAEWSVSHERVQALAQANSIRRHEVAGLLAELQRIGVIDTTPAGVAILGVSQAKLFEHASQVFEGQNPKSMERAAITLSEAVSILPISEDDICDQLADEYRLSAAEKTDLAVLSKQIGFVDHESVVDKTLLFNGSLFKRGSAEKPVS